MEWNKEDMNSLKNNENELNSLKSQIKRCLKNEKLQNRVFLKSNQIEKIKNKKDSVLRKIEINKIEAESIAAKHQDLLREVELLNLRMKKMEGTAIPEKSETEDHAVIEQKIRHQESIVENLRKRYAEYLQRYAEYLLSSEV